MLSLTATPAKLHPPVATQIRILADDLTGACDSAAAFLASGHTVRVWLGPVALESTVESVQAFNTASRDLSPSAAAQAVSQAAAHLKPTRHSLTFKKIDSAGRGSIAAELFALHRALGTDAILLAPSFPAAGRTVRGGILYIRDQTGNVSQIPLLALFQLEARTAQIENPSQIPHALAAGATVLICDASTQSDLDAYAALDSPNLLYAGSAGLAQSLAKVHPAAEPGQTAPLPTITRALTISGTPHPVTHLQLQHLADALPNHPRLHIRAEPADAPEILADFHRHAPQALILTGGDTALLVLTTLGAQSILLRGELALGIPWGIIQGALADGRVVITKSGGFGSVDALTNILKGLA